MPGDTLYHLRFHAGGDFYFGSIAAIFDMFDKKTLRVSRGGLYNFGVTEERPYKNKVCEIKYGEIRRKKGGRGKT